MTAAAPLRVFSRRSLLARLQVEECLPLLQKALPDAVFQAETLETIGDRDLNTALTDASVPGDFFSRDLDRAQLSGEADIVVHSAKDLPQPLPEGLVLAAMLPARDTRDALVIRDGVDLTRGGVIGTSSPVREAAMREIYPDCEFRSIRGDIGRRLARVDAGDYDAVIIAGCALQRLNLADRVHEWLEYETTPLQGRLALTVREDRENLIEALRAIDVRRRAGLVALVGCPADARLLGGLAKSLIQAADIILHDRLIPAEILDGLGERAEYVGKKGHAHSTTQAHIHRRILHEAESGKLVLRLHGGEPGVLGHLGETLEFCRAWDLRTEVVPAVTAAQLTAARAGCSLTHRKDGRSITFLSGHLGLADHAPAALNPGHGNLGIYMGVRDITDIQRRLLEAGWSADAPVTAGMHLGSPEEALVSTSLAEITDVNLQSPAVLLVGPRAHLPCATLFTGTHPEKFLRHGPLIPFPMIELRPRPLTVRAALLREKLSVWRGLILPSSPAVRFFMEALMEIGDVRDLAGKKILAVGPHTADTLAEYGIRADAVPEGFGGAAALSKLPGLPPGVYGYPTSSASPVAERQQALRETGITLDPAVFYENRALRPEKLPAQPFNRVLFTAGSTVRAYFDAFPGEKTAAREWLAVGTSTLKALRELKIKGQLLF